MIYFFCDKTVKSNTFTYPCSQNILELYRYWCHQKSPHGTSLLPNHNELYRGNCDPSNTFGSFALKSCRVWLGHPGTPYTRYTVLDHCLSKQLGKHCIKHEKKCFFFPISTHREVIYQTREGVFHPISNTDRWNIKHEKECFSLISKQREVIYQTPEAVFHLISKHREVISNTRRSVFPISKHQETSLKTRASTFNQLFEVYFILNRAYLIHASLNPLSYKRRTYNGDN